MLAWFNLRTGAVAGTILAASLVGAVPSALAQEKSSAVVLGERSPAAHTERVPYGDLNLATLSDAKKLNARVSGAVKRVCGFMDGSLMDDQSAMDDVSYHICTSGAWAGARPQIDRAIEQARSIALNGGASTSMAAITISVR